MNSNKSPQSSSTTSAKQPPRCPAYPNCGCDGTGRIAGGLGSVVSWLPKAYRPCPEFVNAGGVYARSFSTEIGFDSMKARRAFAFPDNEAVGTIEIQQDPKGYVAVGDGTGMVTWGSAFCLSDLLQRAAVSPPSSSPGLLGIPRDLSGARVVEVGAGLGLCSLVCCKLGAAEVVATDGSESVLELLKRNAAENLAPQQREGGRLTIRRLRWGDAEGITALRSEQSSSSGREAAAVAAGGAFDVVVMADVAYQRNAGAWPALVSTVVQLTDPAPSAATATTTPAATTTAAAADTARRPPPVVLWAHAARDDESRLESERFSRDLIAPLREHFAIAQVDAASLHPAYRTSNVRVFVLTRRAAATMAAAAAA